MRKFHYFKSKFHFLKATCAVENLKKHFLKVTILKENCKYSWYVYLFIKFSFSDSQFFLKSKKSLIFPQKQKEKNFHKKHREESFRENIFIFLDENGKTTKLRE